MKINRYIKHAKAYTSPGWPDNIEDIIRLGMNEGDFIAPSVVEYLKNLRIDIIARHYPPGELPELINIIRSTHQIGNDTDILLYPGSDNAIDNIIRTFSEPEDTIIMRYPEYGNTILFAQTHGLNIQYIKPSPINNLTVSDIIKAQETYNGTIIYFSNPHNPSGQWIHPNDIETLAKKLSNTLILVDEAYIHFADISFRGTLPLVNKYPNVIVTRTFSKLFGLAGLRIGFAAVNKKIAPYLRTIQRVKDLTYISQMAALKSLESIEEYRKTAIEIIESRRFVEKKLEELGFETISPSYGNFILFKPTIQPSILYQRLYEKGYITRFYTDKELQMYMRVSIWRKPIMEAFIETLREVL